VRREVNTRRQALSPDEECALVKWVERLSCTGHPVRHRFLREPAEEIPPPKRIECEISPFAPLGIHWVERFLVGNPSLKSKVARSVEAACKEVTEEQLHNWFSTFKSVVEMHAIPPANIYNMDETGIFYSISAMIEGFNIGVRARNAWVICSAMEKQAYEAEPGRTEWVKVVECICGDGSAIHPLVIFKGEMVQTAWTLPEMNKDWS